jgi:hypothetical protein
MTPWRALLRLLPRLAVLLALLALSPSQVLSGVALPLSHPGAAPAATTAPIHVYDGPRQHARLSQSSIVATVDATVPGRQPSADQREPAVASDSRVAAEEGADVLATPTVENTKLQNVINDLYKGTTNPNRIGPGTTADAVRNELETGQPTGGTFHFEKAQQYSNALNSLLKGNLSDHDRLVAQSLLDDLQSSLGNTP